MELFTHLADASFNYEDVYYELEDKLHEGFPTMEELAKVIARINEEEIQNAMIKVGFEIINREIDDYVKENKEVKNA